MSEDPQPDSPRVTRRPNRAPVDVAAVFNIKRSNRKLPSGDAEAKRSQLGELRSKPSVAEIQQYFNAAAEDDAEDDDGPYDRKGTSSWCGHDSERKPLMGVSHEPGPRKWDCRLLKSNGGAHAAFDLMLVFPGETRRTSSFVHSFYQRVLRRESHQKVHNHMEQRQRDRVIRFTIEQLKKAGLVVSWREVQGTVFVLVGATEVHLELFAEVMQIPTPVKDCVGLGARPFERHSNHPMAQFEEPNCSVGCGRRFPPYFRQMLLNRLLRSHTDYNGCDLDIGWLTNALGMEVVPLHDMVVIEYLEMLWGSLHKAYLPREAFRQPLKEIVHYFGPEVAVYFAWLGHYTRWCRWPALAGTVMGILLVVNWYMSDGPLDDTTGLVGVLFSIFSCIWALAFNERWKTIQQGLSVSWGAHGAKEAEPLRDGFAGEAREVDLAKLMFEVPIHIDVQEGKVYETHFPVATRRRRYLWTVGVCVLLLAIATAGVVGMQVLRNYWSDNDDEANHISPTAKHSIMASVINGVFIVVANYAYSFVALKTTDVENHRTDSRHNSHIALKNFPFMFFTSYLPLILFAVHLNSALPGHEHDSLRNQLLFVQLLIILLVRLIFCNISEILLPRLFMWYTAWRAGGPAKATSTPPKKSEGSPPRSSFSWRRKLKGMDLDALIEGSVCTEVYSSASDASSESSLVGSHGDFNQFEQQYFLPVWDPILDYSEMCIQFGYVALFAPLNPFGPLLALINNLFEIRIDAGKLLRSSRRPIPTLRASIDPHQKILDILVILSVVSNSLLVCFQSDTFLNFLHNRIGITALDTSFMSRMIAFILLEHALVALLMLIRAYMNWHHHALDKYEAAMKLCDDLMDGTAVFERPRLQSSDQIRKQCDLRLISESVPYDLFTNASERTKRANAEQRAQLRRTAAEQLQYTPEFNIFDIPGLTKGLSDGLEKV